MGDLMMKWLLLFIGLVIAIISVYAIFSNGFSNIKSLKVQEFDRGSNKYNKGKVIKDSSSLKIFTKILNRANHETNAHYEMAFKEDFKVTITYEDDTKEDLFVWKNSGFIIRYPKNDVFRIKNESQRKEFLKVLN